MLSYLLDENISPVIAQQIRYHNSVLVVYSIHKWQEGALLGQSDEVVLQAATEAGLTLVTYDLKTIPPLLTEWAAEGQGHAGVIFVDNTTLTSNDFGGLTTALLGHWQRFGQEDWTDRIAFLSAE